MSRVGPCGLDKGPSPYAVQFRKNSAPHSRPNRYRDLLPSQQKQTSGERRVQRLQKAGR